ncbi:hypothetical protein M9458_004697, partial [Cirrhinus mrigala]
MPGERLSIRDNSSVGLMAMPLKRRKRADAVVGFKELNSSYDVTSVTDRVVARNGENDGPSPPLTTTEDTELD